MPTLEPVPCDCRAVRATGDEQHVVAVLDEATAHDATDRPGTDDDEPHPIIVARFAARSPARVNWRALDRDNPWLQLRISAVFEFGNGGAGSRCVSVAEPEHTTRRYAPGTAVPGGPMNTAVSWPSLIIRALRLRVVSLIR